MNGQTQYQKFGGGLVFPNRDKKEDKHPDFAGNDLDFTCPHCRKAFKIAAAMWAKQGKVDYFALSFTPPRPDTRQSVNRPPATQQRQPAAPSPAAQLPEDDVPF